ncbi:MAG: kelch repeat-containing protein [Candidatus Coatesbacteria bacterium]
MNTRRLVATIAAVIVLGHATAHAATILTAAGDGNYGYAGDGMSATVAEISTANGVAVDAAGNVFIADTDNNRVRRVDAVTGTITTVAGTGLCCYNGDNISATAARLSGPYGVAVDLAGNLYIADTTNNRIREVSAATGLITTLAGTSIPGFNGDNMSATAARLSGPYGVAVDGSGNVFIADTGNNRVRRVDVTTGKIGTLAGTGVMSFNADHISATVAQLNAPSGVAVGLSGSVYIADYGNARVRVVGAGSGLIDTVAGTGTAGYNGDGIAATVAQLQSPFGVAVDGLGNLFIADDANNRVRKVTAASGLISTVAGTGLCCYNGDQIDATTARLNYPEGVAVDASGNLFIADTYNYRVREVASVLTTLTVAPNPAIVGQWVSVTLTVSYTGSVSASGVTATLYDSSGGTLVSFQTGPPGGGIVVAPGTLAAFVWTFSVNGGGTVAFTASTTGVDDVNGLPFVNVDSVLLMIPPAGLSVVKTQSPASPGGGSPVTYTMIVTNGSFDPLTAVMVADTVSPVVTGVTPGTPSGFTLQPVVQTASGTLFSWLSSAPLAPGASAAFTLAGTLGVVCAATMVSNTAFVTASWGATTTEMISGVTGFIAPAATAIAVVKTQSGGVGIGSPVQYRLDVTNVGSGTITSLLVVDTVAPVLVGATSFEPAGFPTPLVTSVPGTGTRYVWSGAGLKLGPGKTWSFTISGGIGMVCAPTASGGVSFVSAGGLCSATETVSNAVGGTILPATGTITVAKVQTPASGSSLSPGSAVSYQITVTNAGSATLDVVTVTDTISPAVVGATATTPSGLAPPVVTSIAGTGTRFAWSGAPLLWAGRTGMNAAVDGLAAGVAGGKLYAVGGFAGAFTGAFEAYDAAADTWMWRATMPTARGTLAAAVIGDTLYAVGGSSGSALSKNEAYDPATNTWTTKASLPTARAAVAAGVVNGLLYAVGGVSGVTYYPTVESYDPAANTWTTKASMPTTRAGLAVGVVGGTIYAVGGWNGSAYLATLEAYDPATDTWTTKASCPTARGYLAAAVVDGRLFAIGGTSGAINLATVEAYDPATDTWTAQPGLPTGREALAAATLNGRIYALGGFNGGFLATNEEGVPGLAPGSSLIFTIAGRVGMACTSVTIPNEADITASSTCTPLLAQGTNATFFTLMPPAPGFSVTSVQVPASPAAGASVTYRVVVANTGTDTVLDFALTDTLSPVVISATTAAPSGFPCPVVAQAPGGTLFTWSGAGISLVPGQVWTFTITGTVGDVCSAQVSNSSYVTASGSCSATSVSGVTGFALGPPALGVSITATVTGGGCLLCPVGYTIVVSNTGAATITQLVLTDTVSPVVTGASADQPAGMPPAVVTQTAGGTLFSWSDGGLTLPPGASFTFTITGTAGSVCADTVVTSTSFLTVGTACGLTGTATAFAGFVAVPPGAAVTLAVTRIPASPAWGDVVTYQLVVTNAGTATLTGVTVTDTLPAVVTAVTPGTPAGFTFQPVAQAASGTLYSWVSNAPFPPGASATFSLAGKIGAVCALTDVSNTGFVSARSDCAATILSGSTAGFLVGPPAVTLAVSVVKTVSPSTTAYLPAGTPLVYTILVTNSGDATVTAVTLVDTVSPIFANALTQQPPGFGPPLETGISGGGTRFVWAATGLILPPAAVLTFTITGSVGSVAVSTCVSSTAFVVVSSGCAEQNAFSNAVGVAVLAVPAPPPPPEGTDPLRLTYPGAALDRNVIDTRLGEIVLVRMYPRTSDPILVRIFTASGRLVRTLRRFTPMGPDQFLVKWDGKTEDEFDVARGVYLVHVKGGGITALLKVLVK